MKIRKLVLLVSAALFAGVFFLAASGGSSPRPPGVSEDQWHALSRDSGIAVVRELPRSIVTAELYVRTEKGWRRVRIENPAGTDLLQ